MKKGTRVLFHSGNAVYEGRIVSMRSDRFGCILVERERINPDVQEARWWRKPYELLVLGEAA